MKKSFVNALNVWLSEWKDVISVVRAMPFHSKYILKNENMTKWRSSEAEVSSRE